MRILKTWEFMFNFSFDFGLYGSKSCLQNIKRNSAFSEFVTFFVHNFIQIIKNLKFWEFLKFLSKFYLWFNLFYNLIQKMCPKFHEKFKILKINLILLKHFWQVFLTIIEPKIIIFVYLGWCIFMSLSIIIVFKGFYS